MSVIDVAAFLLELSPDAPCGSNLEYDPAFLALDIAIQGKAEAQYGDTLIAAEPPDWKLVRKEAIALLERSRDLRVATHLTRALLEIDGIVGFADGLRLLEQLIEQRWEPMHPQLDPDDGNDPTLRVNVLAALTETSAMLKAFKETPLVASRLHGRFSWRDIEIANGDLVVADEADKPAMSSIEAACMDVDLSALENTAAALQAALTSTGRIESMLTEKVGSGRAIDFTPLSKPLKRAYEFIAERVARRAPIAEGVSVDGQAPGAAASSAGKPISGEINSRDDVGRMIDKICAYYARSEPSSPVPLLLERAKRLATKSFIEIIEDMAPDGLGQVRQVSGSQSNS